MRFLKLASDKNHDTDYILLNGGYFDKDGNNVENFNQFDGLLCTIFQPVGVSRNLELLSIKNRQFVVDNKPNFKKYSLSIEILSKYSEFERIHNDLITFINRNKKDGFRLYFRPYNEDSMKYCLCNIEMSRKTEKFKPIELSLSQCSFWLGEEKIIPTQQVETEQKENLFAFVDNGDGHYTMFGKDEDISSGYYCIEFYNNIEIQADIVNNCYDEIPLNFKVYGYCVNPTILLFRKGEDTPIKQTKVYASIDKDYYLEINANIVGNGVWRKHNNSNEKIDFISLVENEFGSPYFYIGHGEYIVKVKDDNNNTCTTYISFQEEYEE